MEVEVNVESENGITGETHPATKAYLTFVAVDSKGKPNPVPVYQPKTSDEKKRFKQAEARRKVRLGAYKH